MKLARWANAEELPVEGMCLVHDSADLPESLAGLTVVLGNGTEARASELLARGAERVAVIGAGPAGLSCAAELSKLGHPVTVFEARPEAGGVLRYGVPEFRLPKAFLEGEIADVRSLGVEFRFFLHFFHFIFA